LKKMNNTKLINLSNNYKKKKKKEKTK